MDRKEAKEMVHNLLCGTHKESTGNHYRDVALGIDKIYDDFENKNKIDVNIKITDLENFKVLIKLLEDNAHLLPIEINNKILEIIEKD